MRNIQSRWLALLTVRSFLIKLGVVEHDSQLLDDWDMVWLPYSPFGFWPVHRHSRNWFA